MDFSEALRLMKEGKKVRRDNWSHFIKYIYIEEEEIYISNKRRTKNNNSLFTRKHSLFLRSDILADDWEVVE